MHGGLGRKLIIVRKLFVYTWFLADAKRLTLTLTIFHVCSPTFIQNSHFPNIFIYCNIIVFLYFIKFPRTQPKWINKLIKTFSSLITRFHFSKHFSHSISHSINSGSIRPFHFSKGFKT